MEQSEKCLDKCDISVVAWVLLTTEGAFAKTTGWPSRVAAGRGRCHIVWLCVFFVCLFLLFGLCLCWFVYTPVCFFGWSWAQHPNLHFVGGAGLITLTNTFLVELGSAPWYRLGPTPQLPCSLAPSMRGQAIAIASSSSWSSWSSWSSRSSSS